MRSFVAGGGSPLAGRAPFVTGVDLAPIDDERDGRRGWYARDVAPDLDARLASLRHQHHQTRLAIDRTGR